MSGPDVEEIESKFERGIRERLEAKEPSEERKEELRREHTHHLVRRTTSQLKLDEEIDVEGFHAETKAVIPDIYCFTCDEWIGLSGIDLRGKPRSKTDAFYLDGPPESIATVRKELRNRLEKLVGLVYKEIDRTESPEEAAEFIANELEQTKFQHLKEGA